MPGQTQQAQGVHGTLTERHLLEGVLHITLNTPERRRGVEESANTSVFYLSLNEGLVVNVCFYLSVYVMNESDGHIS